MNREIAKGQWQQLKGKLRQKWGKLTDDDVERLDGRYESLVGKVHEKYGRTKEEIATEVNDFLDADDYGRDPSRKPS